jgi:hypothetical protein
VQNAVLIAASRIVCLFDSIAIPRLRSQKWLLVAYPKPRVGEIVKHDTTPMDSATKSFQIDAKLFGFARIDNQATFDYAQNNLT